MNQQDYFNRLFLMEHNRNLDEIVSRLKKDLQKHTGELVLINRVGLVRNYINNRVLNVLVRNSESEFVETYTGLITQPYLNLPRDYLDHYELDLIVNQKLSLDPSYGFENIENLIKLEDGNIKISSFDINRGKLSFDHVNKLSVIKSIKDFNLYLGDDDVKQFILERYNLMGDGFYKRINEILRNPDKLKLKKQQYSTIKIIGKLEELLEAERRYKKKIRLIHKSIGGYANLEGNLIEILDEDQASLFSLPYKEMLDSIRECISEVIEFTLKADLHMDPTPYFFEHSNGRVTKNVSEFILELNADEKYKPPQAI